MPPAALALAILLHVLIGAAIWWIAPLQPTEPEDQPIMVMFDSTPTNVGLQAPEKAGPACRGPRRQARSLRPNRNARSASNRPSRRRSRRRHQSGHSLPRRPKQSPQPETGPIAADLRVLRCRRRPSRCPRRPSRDFAKPPAPHPPPRPVQRAQPLPPPPWRRRRRNGHRPRRPRRCRRRCPGPIRGDVLIGQGATAQ